MRNVVILTSGLSGYWTGDSTFKKPDYDTFENVELVQWNFRIMQDAEYTGNYVNDFSSDVLQRIGALANHVDGIDYRAFVAKCNEHRPWDMEGPATLSDDPLLAKIPRSRRLPLHPAHPRLRSNMDFVDAAQADHDVPLCEGL